MTAEGEEERRQEGECMCEGLERNNIKNAMLFAAVEDNLCFVTRDTCSMKRRQTFSPKVSDAT